MGRRGRRHKAKREVVPEEYDPQSYLVREQYAMPEIPDIFQIQEYKEEMGKALKQICSEYKNDYMKLRKRKLDQTIEFDYIPDYRLTVDRHFRRFLEQKVAYVYKYDTSNECYHIFSRQLTSFVQDLKEQILKIDKRNIFPFIATIYDSFSTLKNVSKEISKLTRSMFESSQHNFSCEPLTRLLFRDKIYRETEIAMAIENFKRNHQDCHMLLGNINKMENELENYSEVIEEWDLGDESSSSEDSEGSPAPLQEMELDELVTFINGGNENPKSPRKRKGRRRKKTQKETEVKELDEHTQHDADVEEFRRKLEMTPPPRRNRLKPNLSAEWLLGLREKIRKSEV